MKRKYLQGKRGVEKLPFKLPSFIRDTGISNIRGWGKPLVDAQGKGLYGVVFVKAIVDTGAEDKGGIVYAGDGAVISKKSWGGVPKPGDEDYESESESEEEESDEEDSDADAGADENNNEPLPAYGDASVAVSEGYSSIASNKGPASSMTGRGDKTQYTKRGSGTSPRRRSSSLISKTIGA